MPSKLTPAQRIARAERIRQIMALYAAGATFEAIGRQFGINKGSVYKLWKIGLKSIYRESAEEARVRYDLSTRECIRTVATIMADPKTAAVTRVRATDSRARIELQRMQVLGHASAVRTEVSGVDGAPIAVASSAPTPADARRIMSELFGSVTAPGPEPLTDDE